MKKKILLIALMAFLLSMPTVFSAVIPVDLSEAPSILYDNSECGCLSPGETCTYDGNGTGNQYIVYNDFDRAYCGDLLIFSKSLLDYVWVSIETENEVITILGEGPGSSGIYNEMCALYNSWSYSGPIPYSWYGSNCAVTAFFYSPYCLSCPSREWEFEKYYIPNFVQFDGNKTVPDTSPPIVTLTSPINNTYRNSLININAVTNKPVSLCKYSVDYGLNKIGMENSSSENWFKDVSMSDGQYRLQVYCEDLSGNQGPSEPVYFTINTTLPPLPDPLQITTYRNNIFSPDYDVNENIISVYYAILGRVIYDGAIQTQILESSNYNFSDYNRVELDLSRGYSTIPSERPIQESYNSQQIDQNTYEWQLKTQYFELPIDLIAEIGEKALEEFAKALGKKGAGTAVGVIGYLLAAVDQYSNWMPLYLDEVRIYDVSSNPHNYPYNNYIPNFLETFLDFLNYIENDPYSNYIFAAAYSPVDILITDPAGNRIGMLNTNGSQNEINELPETAIYTGDTSPEFLVILNPIEGSYTFEAIGTENGTYDFEILYVKNGEIANQVEQINVSTDVGKLDIYTFNATLKFNASSDIPVAGDRMGTYQNTTDSNNSYEVIEEVTSGGKPSKRYSYLEHKWTVNVTSGVNHRFCVEAFHDMSDSYDDFSFSYSTSESGNFIDILVVTKASDNDKTQCSDIGTQSGVVYIKVLDTDRTAGERNPTTAYIDYLYIETGSPDTTPPVISNVTSTSVTSNSVIIEWNTNELSDSLVKYGTSPGNYSDSIDESTDTSQHSVELIYLNPNTTYYYVVNSTDPGGNSAQSLEQNFTTENPITQQWQSRYISNTDSSDWSNPDNAFADDGSCTSTTSKKKTNIYNFVGNEFSIPSGATIDGIIVGLQHSENDGNDRIEVSLLDASSTWLTWDTHNINGGGCGGVMNDGYGEPTIDWSGQWTPEHMNSANFQVRVKSKASGSASDWWIDYILVQVYYTPSS